MKITTEVENRILPSELKERVIMENDFLRQILGLSVDILFYYDVEDDIWNVERVLDDGNAEKDKKLFAVHPVAAKRVVHEEDQAKFDDFVSQMRSGIPYVEGAFRMREQKVNWFYKELKGVRVALDGKEYVIGSVKNNPLGGSDGEHMEERTGIEVDPLTKVLNKATATKKIEESIKPDEPGALFILDVDNFKLVNDNLGHLFGDEVLANVAKAIKKLFRYDDIVGRIGGDEFIVYMRNINSLEEVEHKAQKVCEAIAKIYIGEKKNFNISTSVGIVLVPRDGVKYKEVFEKADNAMYYSKNNGKNRYTIYDSNNKDIDSGGRDNKGRMIDYYTTFSENHETKVSKFAYELIDFTFQIMEDTTDVDSTINLLLRKVQDSYKLTSVSIYTINSEPNTLERIYLVSKGAEEADVNKTFTYTKESWRSLKREFTNGYFPEDIIHKEDSKKYHHLSVPMYAENRFIGYIEFVKSEGTGVYTPHEINTFKAFAKILAVYAIGMRVYVETSKLLDRLSEMDALTGLYKYEKFQQVLKDEMPEVLADKNILIAYSDISHFKVINETYGYSVGDRLLKTYAHLAEEEYGDVLCASRVYSDNIVCAIVIDKKDTVEQCIERINRQNDNIQLKLRDGFFDSRIMINTGLYIVKNADEDVEIAVTNANLSRKEAKNQKIRTAVMFSENMMEALRRDVRLTSELPKALENGEIKVFYQPKIECGSTNIIGGEALVRWIKEDGKMVYPDEFIPAFEKNGSIVEVDYYVYERVFMYLAERIAKGLPIVPISLNVSRVHLLNDHLVSYIEELFQMYKIPPAYIEFELTESIYIKNMHKALEFIEQLKELGVKVSMDDFGSGYSSINLLNELPIDVLKIDREFMRHNELTMSDEIIVSSIINMAKKLKLKVLCEGVETKNQSDFLSRIGCDIVQGYLYSKPISEEEFSKYTDEHIHAAVVETRFRFNDSLADDSGEYVAKVMGKKIKFTDGPVPGMRALSFPGGTINKEVVEIPNNIYTSSSYSVSMWIKEKEGNIWTSAFYTTFENGFNSFMPRGWEMKASFRLKSHEAEDAWFDAGLQDDLGNEWKHVLFTYDSKKGISVLYIDGVRSGTSTDIPMIGNAEKVILGGDIYQPSFCGCIADVRFYNAALNAFDAERLYEEVMGEKK
ncbi:MAG: EAL domain-containing protein [Lachnospiraceae bacterium]|nr:EAL domain-containing protein [Lachnospiraceae bacterium]